MFPKKKEWAREATVHVQLVLRITLKIEGFAFGDSESFFPPRKMPGKRLQKRRENSELCSFSKKNEEKQLYKI